MRIGDKIKVDFTNEILTITNIINDGTHLILADSKGHACGWILAENATVIPAKTINSELNVKAWDIRRNAAKRFSCKVMEISWSECLRLAKQGNINYLNRVTKANTASETFEELLSVHESYNPTLFTDNKEDLAILADAFDYYMFFLGKPNRIFRAKNGYYKDNYKIM